MKVYALQNNEFISNGIRHINVVFIPAVTILCNPPYTKGHVDSCWIKLRVETSLDTTNKEQCEERIGMSLLPLK